MLAACLILTSAQATPAKRWYGPVTATFEVQYPGNPYDPDENDVRVVFEGSRGEKQERPAYFHEGTFVAHLVSPQSARYTAFLVRNGKRQLATSEEGPLDASDPVPRGFLRLSKRPDRRFEWDSGDPYYPFGTHIAAAEDAARNAEQGMTWAEVAVGSGLLAEDGGDEPAGHFRIEAVEALDAQIRACAAARLPFQMSLEVPGADAKQRRAWARYAEARWGHLNHLVSWRVGDGDQDLAGAVRSLDPFGRLVASAGAAAWADLHVAPFAGQSRPLATGKPVLWQVPNQREQILDALFSPGSSGVIGLASSGGAFSAIAPAVQASGLARGGAGRAIFPTAIGPGANVTAKAIGEVDWALVRLQAAAPTAGLVLGSLGLADGRYAARIVGASGKIGSTAELRVEGGRLEPVELFETDVLIALQAAFRTYADRRSYASSRSGVSFPLRSASPPNR